MSEKTQEVRGYCQRGRARIDQRRIKIFWTLMYIFAYFKEAPQSYMARVFF